MDEPTELFEHVAIEGDHELDMNTIRLVPCPYTDIITEFADVEIFLISVDSLLLEFCAHRYHNWTLGGQTLVLVEQLKQFLGALEELNAKFKLIIFSELMPLFQHDHFLAFLHPYLLAFLSTSKWAQNLETFQSPLDPRWNDFLHQLTPSFMLMSLENPPVNVSPDPNVGRTSAEPKVDFDFSRRFISIAFHLINEAIPVVLFNGFTINFTSVMAFRLSTVPISINNFTEKIATAWPSPSTGLQTHKPLPTDKLALLAECKNTAEFWALASKLELLEAQGKSGEEFEQFCNAVILSALVCSKLNIQRRYLETEDELQKGPPLGSNEFRRRLFTRARQMLLGVHSAEKQIQFPLDDLWDGRMLLILYKRIMAKVEETKPKEQPTQKEVPQPKPSEPAQAQGPLKYKQRLKEAKKLKQREPYKPKPPKQQRRGAGGADSKENQAEDDHEQTTEDGDGPLTNGMEGPAVLTNGETIHGNLTSPQVLPLRLQEEFAKLHSTAGINVALPTDLDEKFLDPLTPSENPSQQPRIAQCQLYTVHNEVLDNYIPELGMLLKSHGNCVSEFEPDYTEVMKVGLSWKFKQIGDPLLTREEKEREYEKKQMADPKKARRFNRSRQALSSWYQLFSDSLEGQGGQLLVDFSRVVKMPTISEEKAQNGELAAIDGPTAGGSKKDKAAGAAKKEPKPGAGGGKKGGKPGAAGGLSKKDQILKQNRDAKIKDQVESDKQKIDYATGLKTNTQNALDDLMRRLDLDESKALCMYQKVLRYAEVFNEQITQFESLDQKRESALGLVESVKAMFVKYYKYLDDTQKEKILYFWASLGFGRPESVKRRPDKQFNLDIDLVYYQLQYGGRMIDVLSDPKKDERVTGFWPDAWQRRMLDAVDLDKSALIVAPTSAGKTFVSYYCIEKVLRKSNDDVVVYISPSKALTNQIVGSVYARFRGKNMSGGKTLYGIFNNEIVDNVLNCQVLVTIPDCFEQILLSTDPRCQAFISRMKYVILDEVHCINQKDTQGQSLGHIWEHIFLLIRCPFLALSATVSNIDTLRDWLQTAEQVKPTDGTPARKVELITYDERWSELEMSLQRIRECPKNVKFDTDEDQFLRGSSVASNYKEMEAAEEGNAEGIGADQQQGQPDETDRASMRSPAPSEMSQQSKAVWSDVIQFFSPFAVYKLEKLRMFGIPPDQRLTARQILELYQMMGMVDAKVKGEFEPIKYFKQLHSADASPPEDGGAIWINRVDLRKLEDALKNRFIEWMNEDKSKIDQIFARLEVDVKEEFEKRSKPFNMRNSALFNIMPLMDQLKRKEQIPALCFNDDREICEHLAIRVFNEMQKREDLYKASPEFQRRYNLKAEEKAQKLAKRKRDEEERAAKRKGKRTDEEGNKERFEKTDDAQGGDTDIFALLKIRMREDLDRFKLHGRWSDEDIYNRCVENLSKKSYRRSTQLLLRLFERGIGFHHDGISNAERSAVEVLFRRGFLGIVFSTSTLALGMNLPCKTVIFGIDTPKLTPLQFRQMSGRAGRRGFDPAGTVIFMSLPTSKIRRLLTASLATLRGNVPFTTAFMLQLFAYMHGTEVSAAPSAAANASMQPKVAIKGAKAGGGGGKPLLDTNDVTSEGVRKKAAMTLLQAPFVLKTRNEQQKGAFTNLLKFLTLFNIQLLRRMQLIDEKCIPRGFAHFAVHLSQYEPGNLVFIRLLQDGTLHRYVKKEYDITHEEQRAQAKDDLICILAHMFTQKFVPINTIERPDKEAPVLPPLFPKIEESVRSHNSEVDQLLLACLQLSSISGQVENPVLTLSGSTEQCLQISEGQMDFVPAFGKDFQLDEQMFPLVRLQSMDHRGRKIYKNSYALDFWRNPDPEALRTQNRLSIAERWYLINDFSNVLNAIANGIEALATPKDELYKLIVGNPSFKEAKEQKLPRSQARPGIADEFSNKFRKAFKMKSRWEDDEEEETK